MCHRTWCLGRCEATLFSSTGCCNPAAPASVLEVPVLGEGSSSLWGQPRMIDPCLVSVCRHMWFRSFRSNLGCPAWGVTAAGVGAGASGSGGGPGAPPPPRHHGELLLPPRRVWGVSRTVAATPGQTGNWGNVAECGKAVNPCAHDRQ